MKTKSILLLIFSLSLITACVKVNKPKPDNSKQIEENLIKANKYLVKHYQDVIKSYIKHHNLKMDTTVFGMWIKVEQKGTGPIPKDAQNVAIHYKIKLLKNGKTCYDTHNSGIKIVKVNYNTEIRAINETIQMYPVGSKLLIIAPPYMAFGLLGDQKCVPSNAIVLIELEIINIIN